MKAKVTAAVKTRMQAQSDKDSQQGRLAADEEKITAARNAADHLQKEYTSWRESAEEYSEPVEDPRPVNELKRSIDAMQKALDQRTKR